MSQRHYVLLLLAFPVAWMIISPLGDRLEAVSDGLGWQLLPWALLAVFWAVVGFQLWRTRRAEGRGAQDLLR